MKVNKKEYINKVGSFQYTLSKRYLCKTKLRLLNE